MNFSGFLGNDDVKTAVSAAFALQRFPHAIALLGETGCGKKTMAHIIANALVCRNKENAPCGSCPSCVRAAAGSHPDIRIVEGSGVTRSLSVDAVKAVAADAYRMPEEADVSVFVLLLGSRTGEAAQNKLLKLIEEPPEGAVFILVCNSAEQLLPTIRSRVQSYTLKPPAISEAAEYICAHTQTDPEEAARLAALCGGNIGRMLDEINGGESAQAAEIAVKIAMSITGRGDELLKAAAPLQKDRKLCGEVLQRLGVIFRDACVLRFGGEALLSGAPQAADALCVLPKDRLVLLPEIAEEFRQKLERNANMPLLVTCLCARLREAAGR